MLSDLACCDLCQSQYDGEAIFDHDFTNDQGDRYCIKYHPDCTAVVHEGSHDTLNWYHNFQAEMISVPDFGGVEKGFYNGLPEVMVQALPLIPKDKPVYVTGHSRGAARAGIMAAILIKQGYDVIVVVFGSPRAGDKEFSSILEGAKLRRSYRNYHDFDNQDFVCDMPLFCPLTFRNFCSPIAYRMIDERPNDPDAWGILAYHHLFLYRNGVQKYVQSPGSV
jgi:rhodanese-related sulfurtransferase